MQDYLTPNGNGISNNTLTFSDPRFVFISKQRYLQLMQDVGDTLVKINYAFIKGESLSLLAYGKSGKRISSDIDILIPRNSLHILEKELAVKGYKTHLPSPKQRNARVLCLSSSHQLTPYRKPHKNLNIEIDINFDIFWGEYTGKRIDIINFLTDTIEMNIYGCKVKTLPPLKAMIQLILHHYKEMNSIYHLAGHNCINYNMFKDVYYLWKNNQEAISLDKLYAISSEYEIIPYVFYVLYFTNWIFKDTELQKYVETFRTSEGEAHLDYYGLAEKERKPWKVDFQTRLEAENLYEFIRDDLTEADVEKLERNRRIFG